MTGRHAAIPAPFTSEVQLMIAAMAVAFAARPERFDHFKSWLIGQINAEADFDRSLALAAFTLSPGDMIEALAAMKDSL